MRPPCETIVASFLPAIRSLLARELVETHSMSQVKTAELLGTTQPAISQYLTQKRGDKLTEAIRTMPEVKQAVQDVVKSLLSEDGSSGEAIGTICNICMTMRRDGTVCVLHQCSVGSSGNCDVCLPLDE